MVTPNDFLARYPKYEQTNVDEDVIQSYIAESELYIPCTWEGSLKNTAIYYLTAHFIEANWNQQLEVAGNANQVGSGAGGRGLQSIEDSFDTTEPGRNFQALIRRHSLGLPRSF